MNKQIKTQKVINTMLSVAGFSAMFLSMPAYAFNEATLSGIEINAVNDSSYKIVLKTDKSVPVEKEINSDNKIVLDIKNIKPASFVNTIYNNATQIENVIIHPVSNNEIKVFIDGTNVASSMINLGRPDTVNLADQPLNDSGNYDDNNNVRNNLQNTQDTQAQAQNNVNPAPLPKSITDNTNQANEATETVVLKPPVSSFKPLANYDDNNNNSPLDNIKDTLSSSHILKALLGSSPIGWILKLLALAFFIFAGIKMLIPKKKNIKIDLYSDTRNKEMELLQDLNNRRSSTLPGLKDTSKLNYNRINSEQNVRSQYGLHEYQNSQKPSYSKKSSISKPMSNLDRNKGMTGVKNDTTFNALKTKTPLNTSNTLKAPGSISTSKITNRDINTSKVNINGVKFLENMAKIYEKSGRGDLAQGIQNNITRSGR